MKIGILHITDIHFTQKTNLNTKLASFTNAIVNDMRGIQQIYIVISGDVAYSGNKLEYAQAKIFLSVFRQMLNAELKTVSLKFILVPGNHDCNFADYDSQLRKTVSGNISHSTIGEDNSITELCIGVQKDFWDFYGEYNVIPVDKMFYTISDIAVGIPINFHCLNTAWMSQYKETVGALFFPTKRYDLAKLTTKGLNFAVWHHPYNWFNPNTNENNKAEFERFTEGIASTHFLGHEHVQSVFTNENKNNGRRVNLLSGEVFNDDKKPQNSGFQTFVIDIVTEKAELKKYSWNGQLFQSSNPKELILLKEKNQKFEIKPDFFNALIAVKIPLVLDSKQDLKLTDIFIFPDLEPSYKDTHTFDSHVNSLRLIGSDHEFSIIDGETQVGKTSLISMLFVKLYENGIYPIILKGKDITEPNLDKILRRAFRNQYKSSPVDFDSFSQLPKTERVILLDDYQECQFNSATTKSFFEQIKQKFQNAIVVFDSANGILASLKTEMDDVKYYTIKPLGYKKRNELIERYLYLKENPLTYNEHNFLSEVKETFDNVQSILGDKLMPPYPIYVLSITQALQYKPLKQNETSFGYCYQTLIHFSLHKAGISNDDLDSYFNFLTELAYEFLDKFLDKDIEVMPHEYLNRFYVAYSDKFICPTYDVLMAALKKSKIVKSESCGISFGYNYILYYLSAKKISDILHTDDGKSKLVKLFDKLHEEKNANILVFITHHSKDISLIESSLFSLMSVLEDVNPITLEKTDPYYEGISSFVKSIKNDIIESNRTMRTERDKALVHQDNLLIEKEKNKISAENQDEEEVKKAMLPFLRSFRSIEIVGQIIKNRRGSLEISHIREMLTELYTTAFRTIAYYSEILDAAKNEIIEIVQQKVEGDRSQMEEKINNFVQLMSFRICVGVFGKLTHCAGNKELKKLYIEVAQQINSPAAKIVTFGINASYGSINAKELTALVEEFKGNVVALRLLKMRVRAYVYNRNLDYATKQKLASIINMELSVKPFTPRND